MKLKRYCALCGKPFVFLLGKGNKIPKDIYYCKDLGYLGINDEYWECQKCSKK